MSRTFEVSVTDFEDVTEKLLFYVYAEDEEAARLYVEAIEASLRKDYPEVVEVT